MCNNFFHFVGVERPGTSDDSGLNSMPDHCIPYTELSNVSKLEYVGCFHCIFVLLLVFWVLETYQTLLVHYILHFGPLHPYFCVDIKVTL